MDASRADEPGCGSVATAAEAGAARPATKRLHDMSLLCADGTVLDADALPGLLKRPGFSSGGADALRKIGGSKREDSIAKFWLDPVRLQSSGGLSRVEIGRIEKLVSKHQSELMEAWNDYFRG